jgi:hypothetical protein
MHVYRATCRRRPVATVPFLATVRVTVAGAIPSSQYECQYNTGSSTGAC